MSNPKNILIALDAGHGSNTAGKRTPDGYREHMINVRCAYYCEIALKRCGFKTIRIAWNDTVATDDSDISLSLRQSQIKKAKCNASISFHANAHGSGTEYTSANGVETLIHTNKTYAKDSKALAEKIQKRLIEGTPQSNRGVKTQNLAMCNCVKCGTEASVLVEIGFMSNKREAELMKTDTFCKEQAEEIAHGVCDYYGVAYKKSSSKPTTANDSTTANNSKPPYIVRISIDNLNIRKTPSAKDSSNKLNKCTGKGSFTIVEEKTGPINSKGDTGKWGLLNAYKTNKDGWICLEVSGVEIV